MVCLALGCSFACLDELPDRVMRVQRSYAEVLSGPRMSAGRGAEELQRCRHGVNISDIGRQRSTTCWWSRFWDRSISITTDEPYDRAAMGWLQFVYQWIDQIFTLRKLEMHACLKNLRG